MGTNPYGEDNCWTCGTWPDYGANWLDSPLFRLLLLVLLAWTLKALWSAYADRKFDQEMTKCINLHKRGEDYPGSRWLHARPYLPGEHPPPVEGPNATGNNTASGDDSS
jgi:hypothetical protein